MAPTHLPQFQPQYSLIEFLLKLFTIGIFSVEGGAKAWFELLLVAAALFACGYLLWWELIFILIALILGTLVVGMFAILAPQYIVPQNEDTEEGKLSVTQWATSSLRRVTENKLQQAHSLSGQELLEHFKQLNEAVNIFQEHHDLIERLSELQMVVNNVNYEASVAAVKIDSERQARNEQNFYKAEVYRKQQEAEQRRQQELFEKKRKNRIQLDKIRRENGFTGGHPPIIVNGYLGCPPNYPVKVTLNKPDDYYDGIIWKPTDSKYKLADPVWCFSSKEEALSENGRYKFRRPKDSQGRLIP